MWSDESYKWLSSTDLDKVLRKCGSVLLLLIHEKFHTFPLTKIYMKNLTLMFSVQLILHQI